MAGGRRRSSSRSRSESGVGEERERDERAGAEVVRGAEECERQSMEMLEELGFPKGVMPLKELVECGRVRESGFVWMKQRAPSEHYFEGSKTLVSYAAEVTAYVEKGRMKKMTGVKSKQFLLWVPITEMTLLPLDDQVPDPDHDDHGDDKQNSNTTKIHFNSVLGIGKSFPITAFMTEEEIEKMQHTKPRLCAA